MKRIKAEMDPLREKWQRRLMEYEFLQMSSADQAREIGVSDMTVIRWKRDMSPQRWLEIKKMVEDHRDMLLAKPSMEIDASLVQQAKKGDVAAIKLFKENKEGWAPRQVNENRNRYEGVDDQELYREVLKSIPLDLLREALKSRETPDLRVVGGPDGAANG